MSYRPETPEERDLRIAALRNMQTVWDRVLPFAERLKRVMLERGRTRVRCKCPDHPDKFVHARLAGPRQHISFACEDQQCIYRMME